MKKTLFLLVITLMSHVSIMAQNESVVDLGSSFKDVKYYESMYASNPPASDWYAIYFDADSWLDYSGQMDFPEQDAFWLRGNLFLSDNPESHSFRIKIAVDDDCEIYINGRCCYRGVGIYQPTYITIPSSYFVIGYNLFAFLVKDRGGEGYLRCSLEVDEDADSPVISDSIDEPQILISHNSIRLYDYDGLSEKSLKAYFLTPSGIDNSAITWESSDRNVVDVNNGDLVAIASGNATIIASAVFDGVTYSERCNVEVKSIDPQMKVVVVDVPGTLKNLLTDEEKDNVTNLMVFGNLNSDDIPVLRYMAGRDINNSYSDGSLEVIDLSEANFVSGGEWNYNDGSSWASGPNNDEIMDFMFKNCINLKQVVLPDAVTRIGVYSFENCKNLESIVLPNNLISLGAGTFYGCVKLSKINLPASLKTIEGGVFSNCNSLKTVDLSALTNLLEIYDGMFRDSKFENIKLPANLTRIGNNAFYDCYRLKSVTIPASVTSIGEVAFANCGLSEVIFEDNSKLKEIGFGAFANTSLSTLFIPKSVQSIGLNFSPSLKQIVVEDGNKFYEVYDGALCSKSSGSVLFVSRDKTTLNLPEYITTISSEVLKDHSNLTSLVLPSNLDDLGDSPFSGCYNLKDIYSSNLIPPTAFRLSDYCGDVTNIVVYIPTGSLSAYQETEWNNFKLVEKTFENSISLNVNDISVYYNAKGVEDMKLNATVFSKYGPKYDSDVTWTSSNPSVIDVDNNGLLNITGAGTAKITASVTLDETLYSVDCNVVSTEAEDPENTYYLNGTGNLRQLLGEENKNNVGKLILLGEINGSDMQFISEMSMLKTVDLSALTNLFEINGGMFTKRNIESIKLPANLTTIGADAFYDFYRLRSVTIPASVTSIGEVAFANCGLTEVIFEENCKLKEIGFGAFANTSLSTLFIPKSVNSIGLNFSTSLKQIVVEDGNKFYESYDGVLCSKISGTVLFVPMDKTTLNLPEYVTTISSEVLRNHSNLTSLVLPDNVEDMGDAPFAGSYNLKEIYFSNLVPPTGTRISEACDVANIVVYIPIGSLSAYQETEWNNFKLVEKTFENSISLNANDISVCYNAKGIEEIKLNATVFSKYGPKFDNVVTWTSSTPSVIAVDNNGLLNITGAGSAKVTASVTLDETLYTVDCNVVSTEAEDPENTYYLNGTGNLRQLIGEGNKNNVEKLVLQGKLTGTDILFIREIAGTNLDYFDGTGNLKYLDISNTQIVSGGDNYGYVEWQTESDKVGGWLRITDNSIGKGMFCKSTTLNTIILPKSVTSIENSAFEGCVNLHTLVLPETLSYIATYAFKDCISLSSSFVIPETIDSLGYNALVGFENIYAKSSIPARLLGSELVSDDAIIIVPSDAYQTYCFAENWKDFAGKILPDNINYQPVVSLEVKAESDGSGLLTAAGGDEALALIQDLTLSGTINGYDIAIMRNRMPRLHNLDLTNVKIVANPYEYYTDSHSEDNRLGKNAFRELNKLRSVILPNSIDYVGEFAFYDCKNLKSVKMYEGVNTIDNFVFAGCNSLKNVELPEGLLSIGNNVFESCYNMEQITIPSTLLSLGQYAFSSCWNLKSIALPKNITNIGWCTFEYCRSLESVILPTRVNRIESYSFNGCKKLKELRLPPMIESIGDRAFFGCTGIKDVYVYIANAKDIKIDMNTFSCWTTSTLHIPSFSYNTYYWDTQWGQFYTKLEFSDTYEEFYTKNTLELNDETGIIDGTPDATLYEKGGLVVDEVDQELAEVELNSDGTDGASLIAKKNGKIKAEKLKIRIKTTAYQWHFFCFPFDIPLEAIKTPGECVWRQYDGQARSRREGGWKDLAEGTTKLEKGRGYIYQGTSDGNIMITIDNPDLSAKDEVTGLFTHESEDAQDANWNFIGNPHTSYYDINETSYSAPITVWTGNGYEAYRPGDDDYEFAPYQAFFVQTPKDSKEIKFDSDGRETYEEAQNNKNKAKARRARATVDPNRLFVNLEVAVDGDSTYSDKTRVVFNNQMSLGYEQNCDAAKFLSQSDSRSIEIFSIDAQGTLYSINERPIANGRVDLGIKVNNGGSFTISAVRMDIPVYLIDNETNIIHNLSNGVYHFSAEKGNSQRFTLTIDGSEGATAIDRIKTDTSISINDSDNLYDLSGRKLNGSDATGIFIQNGKKVLRK